MKKSIWKNILVFFVIFLIIASLFSLYDLDTNIERVGIQKVIEQINNEEIRKIEVEGTKLTVFLKNGEKEISHKEINESFSDVLNNYQVDKAKVSQVEEIQVKTDEGLSSILVSSLPFIIPFLFIAGFIWFMLRSMQGSNNRAMSFGSSRAREVKQQKGKNKLTFKNVAGVREAKEELKEIVEFLKTPKKFLSLGAKIPKGVLLMGPPGTGKTLLAKAVAGEAEVPFFSISGSEFVEMFVGVGASRVRDLFKKAKKSSPCIIFIDEIDAVGRQRGAGLGGSHDEREQTLNQILVEMDGFELNTNVIIIAATNRPDVLDPALLRPGRFDRRVILDMPDIKDREAILKVHANNKPLAKDVNLRKIAERTPGFSGADLNNVLNEGAILAARRNKKKIEETDILESIEKVLLGPERKSHILSEDEKKVTAYHEAGHALISHILPNADPVHKISIVSRGQAAGYTLNLPEKDKYLHKRAEFIDDLAVFLGGYVAEKEIFGDVTTGASNDLQRATQLARKLITRYGMSEHLAPRIYGEKEELVFLGRDLRESRNYSEKVAELIDQEIDSLINNAVITAKKVINDKKDKLEAIVKALLEKEIIEKEEFLKLMGVEKKDKKSESSKDVSNDSE